MNYKICRDISVPNSEGGFDIETDVAEDVTATILPYLIQLFAKPNMVVAEVGVWEGHSLKLYIEVIKQLNAHVYLIDWWKGSKTVVEGQEMAYKEDIYEEAYQKVLAIIDRHDAHDYVTVLKGDTVEMSKQIPNKHLDLCFVDADHTYEGCKRDIQAYLPKMKKGAIMSGDDMDNIKSFYEYLTKLGTYCEEDMQRDYVEGKGHPGVHAAVWDSFGVNVNTFSDGWYTFVGYQILRGAIGVADMGNDALFGSTPIASFNDVGNVVPMAGGVHVLTNAHSLLIPEGWSQEHVESSLVSGEYPSSFMPIGYEFATENQ
tara:strand:+ start:6980 stop:7927 length:948 start_codon:yes stop_codon:yes gene_type:complete